jgi:hypothetical protein
MQLRYIGCLFSVKGYHEIFDLWLFHQITFLRPLYVIIHHYTAKCRAMILRYVAKRSIIIMGYEAWNSIF